MTKTQHDSETPAHGRQVITACAFIHHVFDGTHKVFLPKRSTTKKFLPGVYELPGGHIEYGEDIVSGLVREIREEFGMRVQVGDPFYVFTYTNPVKGSHSIEVVYFARFTNPIEDITLHPDDHSSFRWFTESEVRSVVSHTQGHDDPEMRAIARGFQLLHSSDLDHGK